MLDKSPQNTYQERYGGIPTHYKKKKIVYTTVLRAELYKVEAHTDVITTVEMV